MLFDSRLQGAPTTVVPPVGADAVRESNKRAGHIYQEVSGLLNTLFADTIRSYN